MVEMHGRIPDWAMRTYRWKMAISGYVCMLVSVKAVPNIRQTLQNHLAAHYASLNHNKLSFQLL